MTNRVSNSFVLGVINNDVENVEVWREGVHNISVKEGKFILPIDLATPQLMITTCSVCVCVECYMCLCVCVCVILLLVSLHVKYAHGWLFSVFKIKLYFLKYEIFKLTFYEIFTLP